MSSRADNPQARIIFLNVDRTIEWEVLIFAEERSIAIGKLFRTTLDKMNLWELMAWGGTSISEWRVPSPYQSLLYQSTSSALVINKEDIYQKKGNTAFQLPYTLTSLTLILTSATTSQMWVAWNSGGVASWKGRLRENPFTSFLSKNDLGINWVMGYCIVAKSEE